MAVNINVPSQVKTYTDLAAFPASGALKTIYIAEDTNKTYRWTGSVYVEVSAAGASGITIGTTAITSGTVGRVLFEGTGNVVQESANLFWDNTNGFLGIGTSTPNTKLHVVGSEYTFTVASGGINFYNTPGVNSHFNFINVRQDSDYIFKQNRGGILNTTSLVLKGNTGNLLLNTTDVNGTARVQGKLTLGNSTASPYQLNVWGGAIESYISLNNTNSGNLNTDGFQIGLESNGTDVYFINRENGFIKFRTNNLDRFSIFSTGNVAINTTTDAGYKLDVNGTARVQNTITLTGINTPNNANLPLALGNFMLDVQTTNPNTSAGSIITTGAITKTDSGVKSIINVNNAVTSTAANFNTLNGFAFTSTINQTLGTIRGIYIAPTLTASTDFRAIETTNGKVIFGNLPTSSAGLPTGAIWNDAGTLKIV
jgi:hypothetical protein